MTGFLIAKGDSILVERYQYARTDKHRLTSFSMAKTITGLLIGIAVKEGAIRSIDDLAETYVPGLKGTEYGRTPIKALLQMLSGVSFRKSIGTRRAISGTLSLLTLGHDPAAALPAVKRFNTRHAEPGQRFSYSSAESVVLGLVLAGATARTIGLCERDAVEPARRRSRCLMGGGCDGPGNHVRLLQCGAAGLGPARPDACP